jgi:hypothetical protein
MSHPPSGDRMNRKEMIKKMKHWFAETVYQAQGIPNENPFGIEIKTRAQEDRFIAACQELLLKQWLR